MKRLVIFSIIFLVLTVVVGVILFPKYRQDLLTPSELIIKQPEQERILGRAAASEACSKLQFELEAAAKKHSRPIKSPYSFGSDEIAIYRAVLQRWDVRDKTSLNVSNTTFPFTLDRVSCECLQGVELTVLLNAHYSFHDLPAGVLLGNMNLVDGRAQMAIVRENDPDRTMTQERSVQSAVRNAFAHGLFSMSEIVFDTKHLHAIVSYGFRCGFLCGNGATVILEKVGINWKVTDRACGGWIS